MSLRIGPLHEIGEGFVLIAECGNHKSYIRRNIHNNLYFVYMLNTLDSQSSKAEFFKLELAIKKGLIWAEKG